MGSGRFNVLFSSIGTAPLPVFLRLIMTHKVAPRYYWRALSAGLVSLLIEPFRWWEKIRYDRKLKRTKLPDSPVFILGHWRSGTTLLHNAMCQDEQFAFVNTFQGVFPNQFFASRWLFKPVMRLLMPETRPADNVRLSLAFPQEEEVALCNFDSFAFYNFFYFPLDWDALYLKYIRCTSATPEALQAYRRRYGKLIAQSLLEYGRTGFISKDPPNTGRIPQLLEMFPRAKFIYIYRHPAIVFQSTLNFFLKTIEPLQLQSIHREEMEALVYDLYDRIIRDYESQKSLIPAGNLVEVRYEDFLLHPIDGLRSIYERLGLDGFDAALPAMTAYLEAQKAFEKATHRFSPEEISSISARLGFAMKLYGYDEQGVSHQTT